VLLEHRPNNGHMMNRVDAEEEDCRREEITYTTIIASDLTLLMVPHNPLVYLSCWDTAEHWFAYDGAGAGMRIALLT
jgi:hypothetical protein